MIEASKPRSLRSSMSSVGSPVRPVIKGGIQKRPASKSEPTGKKRGRPSKIANDEAKQQSKAKPDGAKVLINQKGLQDEEEDEDPEGPSCCKFKHWSTSLLCCLNGRARVDLEILFLTLACYFF